MKFRLKSVIAALALTSAMPAFAIDVFSPCDPNRPSPGAAACAGYFEDNLLGGGPKIDLQNEALDMLIGGDFADIDWTRLRCGRLRDAPPQAELADNPPNRLVRPIAWGRMPFVCGNAQIPVESWRGRTFFQTLQERLLRRPSI